MVCGTEAAKPWLEMKKGNFPVIKDDTNFAKDIPHSLALVEKAEKLLNYIPIHWIDAGIEEAVD